MPALTYRDLINLSNAEMVRALEDMHQTARRLTVDELITLDPHAIDLHNSVGFRSDAEQHPLKTKANVLLGHYYDPDGNGRLRLGTPGRNAAMAIRNAYQAAWRAASAPGQADRDPVCEGLRTEIEKLRVLVWTIRAFEALPTIARTGELTTGHEVVRFLPALPGPLPRIAFKRQELPTFDLSAWIAKHEAILLNPGKVKVLDAERLTLATRGVPADIVAILHQHERAVATWLLREFEPVGEAIPGTAAEVEMRARFAEAEARQIAERRAAALAELAS